MLDRTLAIAAGFFAIGMPAVAAAQQLPVRVVFATGEVDLAGNEVRDIDRATIGPNGEIAVLLTSTRRAWHVDRLASGGAFEYGPLPETIPLVQGSFAPQTLAALSSEGAPLWGTGGELFVEGTLTASANEMVDALVMFDADGIAEVIGHDPASTLTSPYTAVPHKPQMADDGSLLVTVASAWFVHGEEPARLVGSGDAVPGEATLTFGALDGRMLFDGRPVFVELDDYYVWSGSALEPGPIPPGLDQPALRAVQMVTTTGYAVWRGPVAGIDSAFVAAIGAAPVALGPARVNQGCPTGGDLDLRNTRTVDSSGRLLVVENCGVARVSGAGTTWVAAAGDLLAFEGGSSIELGNVNDVAMSPDGNVIVFSGGSQHPTLGSVEALWRVVGDGTPQYVLRAGGTPGGTNDPTPISYFYPFADGQVNDAGEFVVKVRTDGTGDALLAFGQEVVVADLSITANAPLLGQDPVEVVVNVTNAGPSNADDVTLVIESSPDALDTIGEECTAEEQRVVCSLGALAVGESVTMSFSMHANYGSFVASVSSDASADPNPRNNRVDVQIQTYGFDECCYDEVNPPGADGRKGDSGCCATVAVHREAPALLALVLAGFVARRRRSAAKSYQG